MKKMASELAIAGTYLLNLHCQVDDRRTVRLTEPDGVTDAPGVAICDMYTLE